MSNTPDRTWRQHPGTPPPSAAPAWDYPPDAAFEARFAELAAARPLALIEAEATIHHAPPGTRCYVQGATTLREWVEWIARGEAPCIVTRAPVVLVLEPDHQPGRPFELSVVCGAKRAGDTIELGRRGEPTPERFEPGGEYFFYEWCHAVWLRPLRVLDRQPVAPSHLADWAYTATLTDASCPEYEPEWRVTDDEYTEATARFGPDGPDATTPLEALEAFARSLPGCSSLEVVGEALDEACRRGASQLAYDLARRYQPIGRCSHDTRPTRVVLAYAEACLRLGRVAEGLRLGLMGAGNLVPRVAWTAAGARVQPHGGSLFHECGIDQERFLRGALLRFEGTRPRSMEVSPTHVGATMREAFGMPRAVKVLRAVAMDPTLDPLNRLHAVIAWDAAIRSAVARSLRAPEHDDAVRAAAAAQIAACDGLDELSRRWLIEL